MVPRLCLSLLSLLILLVSLWTGTAAIGTTLTVNLTDDEARNREFRRVTPVCSVLFILPSSYNVIPQQNSPSLSCVAGSGESQSCTATRGNAADMKLLAENDSGDKITFNITFDPMREVGCSTYIPHRSFKKGSRLDISITCQPVLACNSSLGNSPDLESVTWWRLINKEEFSNFLNTTDKDNFTNVPPAAMENDPLQPKNDTLTILLTANAFDVIGYYATTFFYEGRNHVNGDTFIVYLNPENGHSSGDRELIFGKGDARNFDKMYCRFTSFPNSTVRWEGPTGSNFSTRDTGVVALMDGRSDLSLSGQLVFDEVQYEDRGDYRCIATHSISGAEQSLSLRLRVRHPLRPLWPALGILASLIITFLFIAGGALVDRIRGKQGVDDDDGSFQRNYSVVSNLGEESGEGRRARKHQAAGKRISITQQELLSDSN